MSLIDQKKMTRVFSVEDVKTYLIRENESFLRTNVYFYFNMIATASAKTVLSFLQNEVD